MERRRRLFHARSPAQLQRLDAVSLVYAYILLCQTDCIISSPSTIHCIKAILGCSKKMTSQGNKIFPLVLFKAAASQPSCLVYEGAIFMKLLNGIEDIMTVSPTQNALTSIVFPVSFRKVAH